MISGHDYHIDSFGTIQSVLAGAGDWTNRLVRNTKIVMPHIAKAKIFSYKCQFNHNKHLGAKLDDFHIHMIPIDAVVDGNVIALDYKWGWINAGAEFPDTLPNTGTVYITINAADRYKVLVKAIVSSTDILPPKVAVSNMDAPANEYYSSTFYIECTRRNDAADTYAGEFALDFGDSHHPSNRFGSYNVLTD